MLKGNGALIEKEVQMVDVDENFKPDREFYNSFTDFDEYLEDPSRDWRNPFIN